MSISRREFIKKIGMAISGFIGGGFILFYNKSWIRQRLDIIFESITNPVLEESTLGVLDGQIVRTLLLVTESLVDTPVDNDHYEEFFMWRAENVPGYRVLYERFYSDLNSLANKLANDVFDACSLTTRQKILREFEPNGKWLKTYNGIFNKIYFVYDKFIIKEILNLFANTDAWILLGYRNWLGEPRGLDQYTKALN